MGSTRKWLRQGAPAWVLSIAGIVALASILLAAALTSRPPVRGYAEFRAVRNGCFLMPDRALNALRCSYISPSLYEIEFSRDVSGSAPVATRSTCCPGAITVSISDRRKVLVGLPGERDYPVVAQVVVP